MQERKTLRNMVTPEYRRKLFDPENISDELGDMKDEVWYVRWLFPLPASTVLVRKKGAVKAARTKNPYSVLYKDVVEI